FVFLPGEEGIGGCRVTGVQTCALPISGAAVGCTSLIGPAPIFSSGAMSDVQPTAAPEPPAPASEPMAAPEPAAEEDKPRRFGWRSEERRVGKEGRPGRADKH